MASAAKFQGFDIDFWATDGYQSHILAREEMVRLLICLEEVLESDGDLWELYWDMREGKFDKPEIV